MGMLDCKGLEVVRKQFLTYPTRSVKSERGEGCVGVLLSACELVDGMNTTHSLGITRIVAPLDKVNDFIQIVLRLKEIPSASELTKNTLIPIKICDNRGLQGLKRIIVERHDYSATTISSLRNSDVLWT
ncbi:hypothetical protein AVEN_67084-1 [Araneus ventricosus]|uniref:Uncharacterized protein n=1 Tax=Araneus ventricosus TaxID=182803 RepID=A0A4Y2FSX9_ARAVE|nr:hypothetical protein AVEN_67084-1 [Araneus ventricosus]